MRIRILGSVFLTNGSGCGSGRPENTRIRMGIRIRNTLDLHHSSKIKSHREVTKQYQEIKVFLIILILFKLREKCNFKHFLKLLIGIVDIFKK
jgi:hypothetical protein